MKVTNVEKPASTADQTLKVDCETLTIVHHFR